MTLPYICSACCSRIVRQSSLSGNRQVAFASSHALEGVLPEQSVISHPRHRPRYSRPHSEQPQLDPRRHNEDNSVQSSIDLTSYITTTAARTSGRYSRQHRQFPDLSPPRSDGRAERPPRSSRPYTSELEELLKAGRLSQAWQFFVEIYPDKACPALTRPSMRDVAKVRSGSVFLELLSQVTTEWKAHSGRNSDASNVILPVEVIQKYEELGLASPAAYARTLWAMSVTLLGLGRPGVAVQEPNFQHNMRQLMDVWSLCLRKQSVRQDSTGADAESASLTSPWSFVHSELLAQRPRRKGLEKYFDDCFALFVPSAQFEKGRFNHLAASALLTHDLLTSCPLSNHAVVSDETQHAEFISSVEALIQHTTLDSKHLKTLSQKLKDGKTDADTVTEFMQRIESRLQGSRPARSEVKTHAPDSADLTVQKVINRVGRAVEQQNLDLLENLWDQAQALLRRREKLPHSADSVVNLYEQFLMAFFRLRRPQSALHVWNAMVQSGAEPTVRTWTVMMKGCHISRDVVVMESMWRRMRDSGVQPDLQAWSTRIQGLLKVGKVQEGLQALDEMSREWAEANRNLQQRTRKALANVAKEANQGNGSSSKNDESIPKPDTAILNSAVSALGSRGMQYVPNILAWSRSMGIDPDIITYNSLLNLCLAQGQQEEAMKILKNMADANVAPDSATSTILINAMFHSSVLQDLDHSAQEEHVMDFVVSLESNGVLVDEKGYSLLIDRLLKEYGNEHAVQRILGHMAYNRVAPTPHIYTILMTYYFDTNPPNLPAADALWNDIRSRNNNYGAALDVIFYDRMVEGYSRHGDVGRTMAFLTRMSKEGKRPGWLAMVAVVKCLAKENDWDRLTQVVIDCHRQEGLLSAGVRGTKGQAEFWQLVKDMGVLDHLALDID